MNTTHSHTVVYMCIALACFTISQRYALNFFLQPDPRFQKRHVKYLMLNVDKKLIAMTK